MHDASSEIQYRCPGQDYPISRSVHLARMAGYYPPCRTCPHGDDMSGLSRRMERRLQETRDSAKENAKNTSLFFAEGAAGVYLNDIGPPQARRMAAALGIVFREAHDQDALEPPVAIVAGDGRPFVPELVAAVAEGLRWSGCHVVDIGQASAPCAAFAVDHFQTDGGILVGNPGREPHCVGLKFWAARGMPLSTDEGQPSLDDVRQVYEAQPARPCRKYGSLKRLQVEDDYLATLVDHYHALRPLRLLLDCPCKPLVEYLQRLTGPLACEIICYRANETSRPLNPVARDRIEQKQVSNSLNKSKGWLAAERSEAPDVEYRGTASLCPSHPSMFKQAVVKHKAHLALSTEGDGWLAAERSDAPDEKYRNTASLCSSHPSMLKQAVVKHKAHLALSIEGDGETCTVFDERGQEVEPMRLAELIGRHLLAQDDTGSVVLEHGICAQSEPAGQRRARTAQAMRENAAVFGCGRGGRLWYASDGVPLPDALRTLTLLLEILSQSDRPLSTVLDD